MRAPREFSKPRPLAVSLARFSSAVVACAAMLAAARGASLQWDGDGLSGNNSLSGAGLGGAGFWNQVTSNWWGGTGGDQPWINAGLDTAFFGGTAGIVTINSPVTAANLVFNTTGYNITAAVPATDKLTLDNSALPDGPLINLNNRAGTAVNATITSNIAGTQGLTLNGNTGKLTLDYTGLLDLTGALRIRSGTLEVKGFKTTLNNEIKFVGSGTFRYDNEQPAPPPPYVFLDRTLGPLTFSAGDGVVRIDRTVDATVRLTFGTLTRAEGATGTFATAGFGATIAGDSQFRYAGAATGFLPGYFAQGVSLANVVTPGGFAFYDAGAGLGGSIRLLNYTSDPNSISVGTAATVGANAGKNVRITGAITGQNAPINLNSLEISGASNFVLLAGANNLTIGTDMGAINKTGGNAATISAGAGAGLTVGGAGNELILRTDAAGDSLTITAPILSSTRALTKSGPGTVTLIGTLTVPQAFTGTTYVNGGKLSVRDTFSVGTGSELVLNGGTYEFQTDGNNGAGAENLPVGKNVTVNGMATVAAAKGPLAAGSNKTVAFGTLSIGGGHVLTADPVAGYGISFGAVTLAPGLRPTFNVNGTQPSGSLAGLTLVGKVTGANAGLIKRGTGTLVLASGTNDFGGAGGVIEIQGGLLSVASDNALGAGANSILLNTPVANEGLLVTGPITTLRDVTLAQATNSIEVTGSNVLTLNGVVSSTVTTSLNKRGTGTLVLGNANNTFGGVGAIIDVQSGLLSVGSAGALGNAFNSVRINAPGIAEGFKATGITPFTATQAFLLGQATNSINVESAAQVFTIGGAVSNAGTTAATLVKTGPGTLVLSNPLNTFGGAGKLIDIQDGFLEATSVGSLGDIRNEVNLNTATGGFRASGSFIARQKFTLANAVMNTIAVNAGQTLTISGTVENKGTIIASLTKVGAGTLALGNGANTFGGAGATITVTGGVLAALSNESLGSLSNSIVLNSPVAGEGFRAIGSFSTARTFTLSNPGNNSIDVTQGNTLTLNNALSIGVTSGLVKGDLGTLVLTQPQAGWNGVVTITGGAVRITNATALGTATGNTVLSGLTSALELAGVTTAEPLTIGNPGSGTSMVGANFGGALRSVSGTSILSGPITFVGTTGINTSRTIALSADVSSTLTITGPITDSGGSGTGRVINLLLTGDGTGNLTPSGTGISSSAGATFKLIKSGSSTVGNSPIAWFLGGAASTAFTGVSALEIRSGILQNNATYTGSLPATTPLTFSGSGTFRHDNNGAGAGGFTRSLGTLTFSEGDGTVLSQRTAVQDSFLAFNTLAARVEGATGRFQIDFNGSNFNLTSKISFANGVTPNSFLGQGYVTQIGTTASEFGWYDTNGFVRAINYGVLAEGVSVSTPILVANQDKNVKVTTGFTGQGTIRVNTLNIVGPQNIQLAANAIFTVGATGAGTILKSLGNANISALAGTGGITAGGSGQELILRTEGSIDFLSISASILGTTGALTKSGLGTVFLTGANFYTGKTYVNGGTLAVVNAPGGLGTGTDLGLSGGILNYQTDADGTSTLQAPIVVGKNVQITANSGLTVGRATSAPALNKTLSFGTLSIGNQTLTTTVSSQYGVLFSGATNFVDPLPPTFNVVVASATTPQASNVVQALTLNGPISSNNAVGFVKTGLGTLVLGNNGAASTFGGAGALIDIRAGIVAAGSDGALGPAFDLSGSPANSVVLNLPASSTTGTEGFRAIGTFATSRTFFLSPNVGAVSALEVTQGNMLTLNSPLNIANPAAQLFKNDSGVLEFGADNPNTWTGTVTINSGAIRLKTAGGLGVAAGHTITIPAASGTVGAALQLSGDNLIYNPYVLTTTAGGTGINNAGVIENISGNNTWVTALPLVGSTVLGATAGSVTFTGGISGAFPLILTGAGNVNLTTTALGAVSSLTKNGTGTATLGVASPAFVAPLATNDGTLVVSGAGTMGTGTILINPGSTLSVIDSGTATNDRLASRVVTFQGGNFNYVGSTAGAVTYTAGNTSIRASLETLVPDAAVFRRGLSVITVTAQPGQQALLVFNGSSNNVAPAQNSGTAPTAASVLFRGTNLGSPVSTGSPAQPFPDVAQIRSLAATGFVFNGASGGNGSTSKAIMPWALIDTSATGEGSSFATADQASSTVLTSSGTNRLRPLNPVGSASPEMTASPVNGLNVDLSTGFALTSATAAPNSLTLEAGFVDPNPLVGTVLGGGVTLSGIQALTITSGGILAKALNAGILGGVLSAPLGNSPLNIWTPGVATNLTITSALSGGNNSSTTGLVKAGAGTLTLTTPISGALPGFSGNTFNALTALNQGTLKLDGGANTLYPNTFVNVGPAGTLDLNGNNQYVQGLFTDGLFAGTGGVVTSTAPAALVANYDNTLRTWAGSIQGAGVSFSRSGQNTVSFVSPNAYMGATQVNGGITVLRDAGTFSGTTALDLNYATLTLENKFANLSLADNQNRLNDAVTVSLRGGTLTLSGREQTISKETVGAMSLVQGLSTINVTAGGVGVNSAELTMASLDRPVGSSAMVNFPGTISTFGTIGSNPRVRITSLEPAVPPLTNKIIGPWAIVGGVDYASYNAGVGVGALGAAAAGFANYDQSVTTFPSTTQPAQNVKLSANTATVTSTAAGASEFRLYTLNWVTTATGNLSFAETGDFLNLAGGGLLKSGAFANSIGGALNSGRLTAGGGATSGTSDLYIYNNSSTLTLNSGVVNTSAAIGSGTGITRLVLAGGGTISIPSTVNTYTGGTVVNGGTVTLNGAGVNGVATAIVIPAAAVAANGLVINAGVVTLATNSAQIAPANVVTLNGPSTFNLVGNNTLAGLAFDNSGGVTAPQVNTSGTLSLVGGGITASSSNVTTTSIVAGKLDLGTGVTIDTAAILFNGQSIAPLQATLALQGIGQLAGGTSAATITKSGAGVLQFNTQGVFTGKITVQAGGIQYGAGNAGSRFSEVALAASARLNLNGVSTVIGGLSGAGTVTNASTVNFTNGLTTGVSLTTGFNNASTIFSGKFKRFGDGLGVTGNNTNNPLNVIKIGTGKLTLTGAGSDSTSTLSVQGGEVEYSGAATSRFVTTTVLTGGTLTLENSATNVNNRLAAGVVPAFPGGLLNVASLLNFSGGTVNIKGNGGVATTETFSTLQVSSGAGVLNLLANPNRPLNVVVTTAVNGQQPGGTLRIIGLSDYSDVGLGTLALGTDASGAFVSGTLNNPTGAGAGFPRDERPIRPDIIANTTIDLGSGPENIVTFVTKDTADEPTLLRPLYYGPLIYELNEAITSGAITPTNYMLFDTQSINENTSAYSLSLRHSGVAPAGVTMSQSAAHGQFGPNGSLLTLTVVSGGIISDGAGTNTLNVSRLSSANNTSLVFHALSNLVVNGIVSAGTGGLTKSGDGMLTLNSRGYYLGTTTVNEGTLLLNGGRENSIAFSPGPVAPTNSSLTVNGGLLDLNGRNHTFGTLSSNNANAEGGGIITSGAPATFTSATATSSSFAGEIAGALNFVKSGPNSTLSLTDANTYQGTTMLRGGGITLRDRGDLSGTSAITINYGTLTIDQAQLTPLIPPANLNPARIKAGAPITLFGGTFALTAGSSAAYTASLPTNDVILAGGGNIINANVNTASSAVLTLGNLSRTDVNSMLNFGGSTLSGTGFNSQIRFAGAGPALVNGIIGTWATTSFSDFASYGANGVIPLASQPAGSTYTSTALSSATLSSHNINLSGDAGTALAPLGDLNANVLRVSGTQTVFLAGNATLKLGNAGASGAFLNAATTTTATIGSGVFPGALTSEGKQLFIHANAGSTTVINSVIKDNSAAAQPAVTLVKGGGGALTLNAVNLYSGGTVVNQGTVSLNASGSDPQGNTTIPGDLLINNATVGLSVANQFKATAHVTIDGAGTLNMVASNTIGRITFNNRGGNSNPVVNTASLLNLNGSDVLTPAITSVNQSFTTPVVAGTELHFNGIAPVINTSGSSPNSLVISAPIHPAVGGVNTGNAVIIKNGTGSLVLTPAVPGTFASTVVLDDNKVNIASVAGLVVGMSVSGTGIPAGATITGFDPNQQDVFISANVTTAGTPALTFSGSTFTQGFYLAEGALIFGANSARLLVSGQPTGALQNGPIGTGTLTLDHNTAIMSDGTLRTIDNAVTVLGDFTFGVHETALAPSPTTALAGNGLNLGGTMTLTAGGTGRHAISVNSANNISTISGMITSTGTTLEKAGAGTLVLANAGNNWNGPLLISAGVLRNGAVGAIPSSTPVTVQTGAVLDLNGFNQSLVSLSGTGVVANSLPIPATLTVGGTTQNDLTTNVNSTFGGSISGQDDAFAALSLVKSGLGTFTLSGSSRYKGTTDVNSGILRVAVGGVVTISQNVAVNGNAGSTANPLLAGTLAVNGKLTAIAGTVRTNGLGATVTGTGQLDVNVAIATGGVIAPQFIGGNRLTFTQHVLTLEEGSTFQYQTYNGGTEGKLAFSGNLSNLAELPGGVGWTIKLQNIDVADPFGKTFVLFDGDDGTPFLLAGNDQFTNKVGAPHLDFSDTNGWSGGTVTFNAQTNDIVLTGVVPEPGTLTMLLGGLGTALGLQRFRRRRK